MVMAVVFVVTFSFFPRSLEREKESTRRASLLAWHCCLSAKKKVSFGERESLCCSSQSRLCTCFQTVSPLGPSHHHTHDPCASNVNNPAFPERRGGASVKEWREAIKYREIQQGNSKPPRHNSYFLCSNVCEYFSMIL